MDFNQMTTHQILEEFGMVVKALIEEAIECIENLADQQAMHDPHYEPTLQKLKDFVLSS